MVAKYKVQKFRDKWNDGFFKPKFTNPDSVERQIAKKEVAAGLKEYHDLDRVKSDEIWEAEMSRAWECYLREEADPNYRCTCFED